MFLLLIYHNIEDLRADDSGVWLHGGKPRKNYAIEFDSRTSEVTSAVLIDDENLKDENYFTLVRLYHKHKNTPQFQRRISYCFDYMKQRIQFAVVQYLFEGGKEVPVVISSHGNSKHSKNAYCCTQKSTMEQIKSLPGKPKSIISAVGEEAGGSVSANSASELPRNRRQVYNSKKSFCGKSDPIFELIKQCSWWAKICTVS